MSDKDVDAQFADIIAHWNDVTDEPDRGPRPPDAGATPAAPAAEAASAQPSTDGSPTDGAPTDGAPAGGSGRSATPPAPPDPSPAPAPPPPVPRPRPQHFRFEGGTSTPGEPVEPVGPPPSWRSPEPVDEPEEHFQPGPTAPLPAGDLQFWGILAGLVGGPLMLVYLVLFHREGNPLWMLAAVGITVAGFGLLVQRLPRHRDDDDDGAVL